MNRRKMICLLGSSPVLLLLSCDKGFPDSPTIITGKVIDQDGEPIAGVAVGFIGKERASVSMVPTFEAMTNTQADGSYRIEQVVPDSTDSSNIGIRRFPQVDIDTFGYIFFISVDGGTERELTLYTVNEEKYGTAITVNFIVKKV